MELKGPGYNIYMAGLSGSGKATSVRQMLKVIGSTCPEVFDYAYVNNFNDSDRPMFLVFPKGKAKFFKRELHSTIDVLKQKIPQAFESERYIEKKKIIVSMYSKKEEELMGGFDEELRKEGMSLGQVKIGEVARPDIIPIIDDEQVPIFQLEQKVKDGKLTEKKAKEIIKKYNDHQEELHLLFKKGLKIGQGFPERNLEDLESRMCP